MKLLLTLHILSAIFFIGPLSAASMSAPRAARSDNLGALRTTRRMITIYGWASLAVLLFGMAMVQGSNRGWHHSISDGWILASLLLFAGAFVIVIGVLLPTIRTAEARVSSGESAAGLAGAIAVSGVIATMIYLVITFLMVYKPGS